MPRFWILVCLLLVTVSGAAAAQANLPANYDLGNPTLTTVYVSIQGDDSRDGSSPEQALRTISAAWERIPRAQELQTGYRIAILPGSYTETETPNYWESRYGTFNAPIILEAVNGPETVFLPSMNVFDTRYLYLLNLTFQTGGDAFHCERCDHLLIRGSRFTGAEPESYNTQETVKINQSQHVYVENSEIAGAWDNAVDLVAVQYGHFLNNRIHNAGDWCMYLKGGSAYFLVAQNEFYDCGAGGFTAGQGTGLQYMQPPWIQYEAYDIAVVNNLIHDSAGAGLGVQGGYGILMAWNQMYRVGERSHLLEVGYGQRSCDGQEGEPGRERCAEYLASGGWGNTLVPDGTNFARIPNRHVYILNNVIFNPPGYRSAYQHLTVFPAYADSNGNLPGPIQADDDLVIAGNLIWNGEAGMPLGIEASPDFPAGCQEGHPTCSMSQILSANQINVAGAFAPLNAPMPVFAWELPVPASVVGSAFGTPLTEADISALMKQAAVDGAAATVAEPAPVAEPTAVTVAPTAPAMVIPAGVVPVLPAGPLTVVTLGDSLTEGAQDELERGGYPGRLLPLLDAVRPGSSLLNLGRSGWNSDALISGDQGLPGQLEQAVAALSQATQQGQPALALVWIGSNDLFYLYEFGNPDAAGEQADLDHYAVNLDVILGALSKTGAQVMVALLDDQALRPVVLRGEAFPGISPEEAARMSGQVRRYNAVIVEKSTTYGALLVDFFNTGIFTGAETLADDGNHPNAAGYDQISQIWYAIIQSMF